MTTPLGWDPVSRLWVPLALQPPTRHNPANDSPTALWQFDGNLTDAGPNNIVWTVSNGTARYNDLFPGMRGLQLDGSTRLTTTTGTALAITGDLTIMGLFRFQNISTVGTTSITLSYESQGAAAANNVLYSFYFATQNVRFLSQHGTKVSTGSTFDMVNRPSLFELCHWATTRIGDVVQHYLNGLPIGSASPTQVTPTGGTSSFLNLGANSAAGNFGVFTIGSLFIKAGGLSAATIKTRANACLAPYYGAVA